MSNNDFGIGVVITLALFLTAVFIVAKVAEHSDSLTNCRIGGDW